MKTVSMENVSTGELDRNKEHYLRKKDKTEKSYADRALCYFSDLTLLHS